MPTFFAYLHSFICCLYSPLNFSNLSSIRNIFYMKFYYSIIYHWKNKYLKIKKLSSELLQFFKKFSRGERGHKFHFFSKQKKTLIKRPKCSPGKVKGERVSIKTALIIMATLPKIYTFWFRYYNSKATARHKRFYSRKSLLRWSPLLSLQHYYGQ